MRRLTSIAVESRTQGAMGELTNTLYHKRDNPSIVYETETHRVNPKLTRYWLFQGTSGSYI